MKFGDCALIVPAQMNRSCQVESTIYDMVIQITTIHTKAEKTILVAGC
jgi:hypothetical protein